MKRPLALVESVGQVKHDMRNEEPRLKVEGEERSKPDWTEGMPRASSLARHTVHAFVLFEFQC